MFIQRRWLWAIVVWNLIVRQITRYRNALKERIAGGNGRKTRRYISTMITFRLFK